MRVLIVEDNPGDQRILKEAFKRIDPEIELRVVENADEAHQVLQKGPPQLILLDLNLPGKSGKEFLKELKSNKSFHRIPVLVLTSSQAEKDINDCYDLGANCYLNKPMKFQNLFEMIGALCRFWNHEVTLPLQARSLKLSPKNKI